MGKGRRSSADLNGFVTAVDERVDRCGGGKEPFLIGVAGGGGVYSTFHDPHDDAFCTPVFYIISAFNLLFLFCAVSPLCSQSLSASVRREPTSTECKNILARTNRARRTWRVKKITKKKKRSFQIQTFTAVVNDTRRLLCLWSPLAFPAPSGTASGKTTVCDLIMHNLQEKRVVLIAQDSFYRGLTPHEHANVSSYNFDHPEVGNVYFKP